MTLPVQFEEFAIPGAREYDGNVLPYGLTINSTNGERVKVSDAATALHSLGISGKLTQLLERHGAVLFRGVGNPSADTFSELVNAAEEGRGLKEHEQVGLAGKRTPIAKAIWTANEGPNTTRFYQHNEVRKT